MYQNRVNDASFGSFCSPLCSPYCISGKSIDRH
jgi:hypothetical protein